MPSISSIKRKSLQREQNESIKKNFLALFSSSKRKVKSKSAQKIVAERSNTSIFGRLYIANQQHEEDPGSFSPMKVANENNDYIRVRCTDHDFLLASFK